MCIYVCVCICIYIYIYIYIHVSLSLYIYIYIGPQRQRGEQVLCHHAGRGARAHVYILITIHPQNDTL